MYDSSSYPSLGYLVEFTLKNTPDQISSSCIKFFDLIESHFTLNKVPNLWFST